MDGQMIKNCDIMNKKGYTILMINAVPIINSTIVMFVLCILMDA